MKKKKTTEILLTAFQVLICLLLVPVLILNIVLTAKGYLYPDQTPDFMGYMPVIVQTDAMMPVFGNKDLAIAKKSEGSEVQEKDIIAYNEQGEVFFGRIQAALVDEDTQQKEFFVKAESVGSENIEPVLQENIIGLYKFRIKGAGGIAMFLQTPAGMFLFMIVPVLCLAGYESIRRRFKKKKDKTETSESAQASE